MADAALGAEQLDRLEHVVEVVRRLAHAHEHDLPHRRAARARAPPARRSRRCRAGAAGRRGRSCRTRSRPRSRPASTRTGRRAAAARSRPSGRRPARPAGAPSRPRPGAPSARGERAELAGERRQRRRAAAAGRKSSGGRGPLSSGSACVQARRIAASCPGLAPAARSRSRSVASVCRRGGGARCRRMREPESPAVSRGAGRGMMDSKVAGRRSDRRAARWRTASTAREGRAGVAVARRRARCPAAAHSARSAGPCARRGSRSPGWGVSAARDAEGRAWHPATWSSLPGSGWSSGSRRTSPTRSSRHPAPSCPPACRRAPRGSRRFPASST